MTEERIRELEAKYDMSAARKENKLLSIVAAVLMAAVMILSLIGKFPIIRCDHMFGSHRLAQFFYEIGFTGLDGGKKNGIPCENTLR